jgi:hypothetical protein
MSPARPDDAVRLTDPTIVIVAVTYGLLLTIAGAAGLFGLPLYFFVTLSLWRYSYHVLKHAAQGRSTLPAPGIETMSPIGDFRLLLHLVFFSALLFLLAGSAVWGDDTLVTLARWSAFALVAAAFPASAGLMAVNTELAAAMNPRAIWSLIGLLGARYARLLVIAAALLLLSQGIAALRIPLLGGLLSTSVNVWTALAVFCLTGMAIRARRDVLDIPGEREPEEEWRARERRAYWRKQMDYAYVSIRGGLVAQGYRTVTEMIEQAGEGDEAREWVLEDMRSWEDKAHALVFARDYVERLLGQGEDYRALELASQYRSVGDGIALDGITTSRLADYARSIGKQGLADDLLERAGARPALP